MPFGSVKLRSTAVAIDRPSGWSAESLTGGNFLQGRSLETAALPYARHKVVYEGPAKGKMRSEAGMTMKYGALCLELIK
jgi:hypothetical protein